MVWNCCWASEVVKPDGCPHILDNERELRFSLKRRFLEKCLECSRFSEDLNKLTETEPSVSAVFRHLIAEFLDQKEQIHYMAGFLNSRNREIQFLHEIGVVLQTSMELDEVLSVAMTAITAGKGFGLNRAFLLLTDEEKRILKGYLGVGPKSFQEAWQIWDEIGRNDLSIREMAINFHNTKLDSEKVKFEEILERLTIPLDNQAHIFNKALLHGKPILVQDALNDSTDNQGPAKILGVDTFLILPLISRKRRIGVIIADNFITRRPITSQDMESMEILAFPLALAIERASLYARLQEDLDKLSEANNKLREQQELIVKMEKMALVGKITSGIAHSIRNPLMIIGGFARSLQKSIDENDPKRKYVESILDESRKLEDTLSEALGYADSLHPVRDMWDVNELASSIHRELREKMAKQEVVCVLNLMEDLPRVFIDYKQITFCLRKIICNTMEAMPEGGEIKIITRKDDDFPIVEILGCGKAKGSSAHDFTSASFFAAREQPGAVSISVCRMILEKNSLSFHEEKSCAGGIRYIIRLPITKEEMSNE